MTTFTLEQLSSLTTGKNNDVPLLAPIVLKRLKTLLTETERCRLPYPDIIPHRDGKVVLEWHSPSREMLIEIAEEGMHYYALAKPVLTLEAPEFDPRKLEARDGLLRTIRGLDNLFAWYLIPLSYQA